MADEPVNKAELRTAVENEVRTAVRQEMTSYRLQQDQHHEDLRLIKWTLFGNAQAGEPGLVASVRRFGEKLDSLIEQQEARAKAQEEIKEFIEQIRGYAKNVWALAKWGIGIVVAVGVIVAGAYFTKLWVP